MKDIVTGLIFVAIGSFFGIYSLEYSIGSSSNMGPAFFPLLVSFILISLGALLLIKKLLIK